MYSTEKNEFLTQAQLILKKFIKFIELLRRKWHSLTVCAQQKKMNF
jgi:hypothetical protein